MDLNGYVMKFIISEERKEKIRDFLEDFDYDDSLLIRTAYFIFMCILGVGFCYL